MAEMNRLQNSNLLRTSACELAERRTFGATTNTFAKHSPSSSRRARGLRFAYFAVERGGLAPTPQPNLRAPVGQRFAILYADLRCQDSVNFPFRYIGDLR